jgi:hypothetical protein
MALHRQFLFLIGQFLKISSSETETMAGSIYGMSSRLKCEKLSDDRQQTTDAK